MKLGFGRGEMGQQGRWKQEGHSWKIYQVSGTIVLHHVVLQHKQQRIIQRLSKNGPMFNIKIRRSYCTESKHFKVEY